MANSVDWSHQTVLRADPVSASLARQFVCTHLAAHGLQHLVEDVRLVVTELATNAVEHARTSFILTLSMANSAVRVGIVDESTSAPVACTPLDTDTSGRGLLLVDRLSQAWGSSVSDGLKTVWASFPSNR